MSKADAVHSLRTYIFVGCGSSRSHSKRYEARHSALACLLEHTSVYGESFTNPWWCESRSPVRTPSNPHCAAARLQVGRQTHASACRSSKRNGSIRPLDGVGGYSCHSPDGLGPCLTRGSARSGRRREQSEAGLRRQE